MSPNSQPDVALDKPKLLSVKHRRVIENKRVARLLELCSPVSADFRSQLNPGVQDLPESGRRHPETQSWVREQSASKPKPSTFPEHRGSGPAHMAESDACTHVGTILTQFSVCSLFACTLSPDSARGQTESFEALPSLPSPVRRRHVSDHPAGGKFDISTMPPGAFERDAKGEDSDGHDATESSLGPQSQTLKSDHQGLVMHAL